MNKVTVIMTPKHYRKDVADKTAGIRNRVVQPPVYGA